MEGLEGKAGWHCQGLGAIRYANAAAQPGYMEQSAPMRWTMGVAFLVALSACYERPAQSPPAPAPPPRIRPIRLAAHERSTCFVNEDGGVYCWGQYCHGAPSYGWHLACPTPRPVPGIEGARDVVLGDALHRDCILKKDDTVWCGRAPERFERVALGPTRSVAHAGDFVCALLHTGKVACWSASTVTTSLPELRKLVAYQLEPTEIVGLDGVRSIAADSGRACAVTNDEKAFCWEGRADRATPAVLVLKESVRALVPGMRHDYLDLGLSQLPWRVSVPRFGSEGGLVCAVMTSDVRCWLGSTTSALPTGGPIALDDGIFARELALGLQHACALRADGHVSCWGANGVGQLGDGTQTSTLTPVRIKTDASFTQVVSGTNHACGLTAGGAIQCWGRNDEYELGTGRDSPLSATPVNVIW